MLVEYQPSIVVLGVELGHTSVYDCFSDAGKFTGGSVAMGTGSSRRFWKDGSMRGFCAWVGGMKMS
jgi:hypothetical protein